MAHRSRPRIYLAGPEVFLPDALKVGADKVALCARHGFEGVFPLDANLDLAGMEKSEQARAISAANEGLMRTCDALIANLTPFRGVSMDSGTAFEVGFMRALGRPVLGYTCVMADYRTRAEAYRARVAAHRATAPQHPEADGHEVEIEDFGCAENLMIEAAIMSCGGVVVRCEVERGQEMRDISGFRQCLEHAARILGLPL